MRPASLRPALFVISFAALAALALAALAGPGSGRAPASAADAETAKLINHFNQYRGSQGVGSLTTSAALNADAQAAAEQSAAGCTFVFPTLGSKRWPAQNYAEALPLWQAYLGDAVILGWVADPQYGSVGIGRAIDEDCNRGHMWWIILDEGGGGPPLTPTDTPAPATATPSPPPSPSATPFVPVRGDVNCDGAVNLADAIHLLKAIGIGVSGAGCQSPRDLDCVNGVDTGDVLTLLRYLGNIAAALADGCPPVGAMVPPGPSATSVTG